MGPLDPGLCYYQYAVRPAPDEEAVGFRNPEVDQEVTGKPRLCTLFVPGPGAEWLAEVSGGGQLATLERALAGLSLGSGHALGTLWAYPGEFGYIGAMSAFGGPPEDADVDAVNSGTELLRVYSGDRQDFTYGATLELIAAMTDRGVEHEFAPVIPGPHSWDVWQKALIDLLPRLVTGGG